MSETILTHCKLVKETHIPASCRKTRLPFECIQNNKQIRVNPKKQIHRLTENAQHSSLTCRLVIGGINMTKLSGKKPQRPFSSPSHQPSSSVSFTWRLNAPIRGSNRPRPFGTTNRCTRGYQAVKRDVVVLLSTSSWNAWQTRPRVTRSFTCMRAKLQTPRVTLCGARRPRQGPVGLDGRRDAPAATSGNARAGRNTRR